MSILTTVDTSDGTLSSVPGVVRLEDDTRDWVFTFGAGQRGYAARDTRLYGDAQLSARGFPLDDRYVVISGTYTRARERMIEIFGLVWTGQYSSREAAGVSEFGLVELVLTRDRHGKER